METILYEGIVTIAFILIVIGLIITINVTFGIIHLLFRG